MSDLITGDLHLTDDRRDAYRHYFMSTTLPSMLKKMAIDNLYVLGDLTEKHDNHGAWLVNTIANHFAQLAQICPITILMANHDYSDINNPFFAFLNHQPNITWIGKPHVPTKLRKRWLFLPHTDKWKEDWKGFNFGSFDAIFAHQTFQGADVGTRKLDGIPTDMFRDTKVYSGDIHTPQSFGPITYVGAPYTIDFGDDYEPRVIVLDDRSKEKSLYVPGVQKRLVDIKLGDKLPEGFEKDDLIKVRVAVPMNRMEGWAKEKERIRDWGHNYQMQIQPTLDPADRKRIRTVIRTARGERVQDDAALLHQYAKVTKVSDRTLKTGLWLLEQEA